MRIPLLLLLTCLSGTAFAQDRAGNNTAGEWVPTHHKIFDEWDSVCDKRDAVDRCYIRYVEVFSPKPKFGAVFVFFTPESDGTKIEFGYERGQRFDKGGFYFSKAGETRWQLDDPCLRSQKCIFKAEKGAEFIENLLQNDTLHHDFIDRYGQRFALEWDLSEFAAVFADFERETATRGLRK